MKNTILILLVSIFTIPLFSQTPVEKNGALAVEGNRIVNKDGNPISFSGGSLFWSNNGWGGEKYYHSSTVGWLASDWKATIIRAAMGADANGGYITQPANKQKVKTVVDAAIDQGIYVIIDWHSHHAEDYETEAIEFFEEMATLYGSYDNVIYEIYNEPLQISWTNVIKPYAENVIAAIRAIDEDNLIIVGTPTWSQDVDVASNNPITSSTNIAYTLHFYAGTHGQSLRNKATTAMNNGIALMVTEWGAVNANGDGAVATAEVNNWVTFMCENNLTNLNWAINDKEEGASALKPGTSPQGLWTNDKLTESGLLVKEIVKNWDANCVVTSLKNPLNENIIKFEVYPNPSSDFLSLDFEVKKGEKLKVEMTDSVGKIFFEENLNIFNSKYQKQINTKAFPRGTYFIKITMDNDAVVSKKVVLN